MVVLEDGAPRRRIEFINIQDDNVVELQILIAIARRILARLWYRQSIWRKVLITQVYCHR